jgi:hypothetical protein
VDITIIPQPSDPIGSIAAVANVVIAAVAVIVAVISIRFTNAGIKFQREHNVLTVRPIPFIALADFENHIRVRIRNDGTGPMIVKKVSAREIGKAAKFDEIVSYMPDLPANMSWANFSSGEVGSIPVGGEVILLELLINVAKPEQIAIRDACRSALSELEVGVEYSDIYGTEFPEKVRALDWFARRLASSRVAK